MKKIDKSSVHQAGLKRKETGSLQSLWIETPGYCNLACPYCFASAGEGLKRDELLSREDYLRLLDEAQSMGVDSIGIPGAGEPFVPANMELTMWLLHECAKRGMYVTLFTTGQFITEELASKLFELPVEIMLKGNTLDADLQDKFVSDPSRGREIHGYGEARNRAIEVLIAAGFNDKASCMALYNRKSRLALVTSIMTDENSLSNLGEIVDLLHFCRQRNIMLDCDSVLTRGRGKTCKLHTSEEKYRSKLIELQEIDRDQYGFEWEVSQGYIDSVCDRYMHHLYCDQYGVIHPCVGAMDINLGNIKRSSLAEAWGSAEMSIIRSRCYGGVCGTQCQNFADGKCNSCLGRRAVELSNENLREKGFVDTIGCWNFRPKAE